MKSNKRDKFPMPHACNNIHNMGIAETWLNNCHTDSEIAIHGYNLQRLDRTEGNGGGVAVCDVHTLP